MTTRSRSCAAEPVDERRPVAVGLLGEREDGGRRRAGPGVGGDGSPGRTAASTLDLTMKTGIHPEYVEATVTCTCGNTFTTRSTKGDMHVEICSNCHPFYTGKQKLVDTGGRVEGFQRRPARRQRQR